MPIFDDSGATYPVPEYVQVVINYYDEKGVRKRCCLPEMSPTLPLVQYSHLAREQIAYKGREKLTLDGGELCGGREIYEEILEWLEVAFTFDDASKPLPPLLTADRRSIKTSALRLLNFHRALLAFDLTSRAQQRWIRKAMWEASDSDKSPDPNWVYETWAELSSFDQQYVDRTIGAAARSWTADKLSKEQIESIRQIARETPDLFEQLDRALDAVHWTGYLDWLISDGGEETDAWETTPEGSVSSMDCDYDENEMEGRSDELAQETEKKERAPSSPLSNPQHQTPSQLSEVDKAES